MPWYIVLHIYTQLYVTTTLSANDTTSIVSNEVSNSQQRYTNTVELLKVDVTDRFETKVYLFMCRYTYLHNSNFFITQTKI